MKLVKDLEKTSINQSEVTDKEAEEAFKTILKWIGDNPDREGLKEHLRSISVDTIKMPTKFLIKLLEMLMDMMTWF